MTAHQKLRLLRQQLLQLPPGCFDMKRLVRLHRVPAVSRH